MRPTAVVALAAAMLLTVGRHSAFAQDAAAPRFELLPDYDFHLSAALLTSPDKRFDWDANFGGEVDLVDYGRGRANFTANYNVVLGHELRNFDPNQGNYVLELSASRRFRYAELHGRFQHTSRHLADRPKTAPIDWNALGVRVTRDDRRSGVRLKEAASLERVIKRSFVDYTWLFGAETSARFDRRGKTTAIGPMEPIVAGRLEIRGADREIANRGAQVGFYAEAGARIDGRKGAMELFGGLERRIDASPFGRTPKTWVMFGFRLVNR